MSISIDFQDVLIFCIAQMLVLLFILFQKKYRVLPNLFLGFVFVLLILHYVYYFLFYNNFFDSNPLLAIGLKSLMIVPPTIIYMYVVMVITGYFIFSKWQLLGMFSGFILSVLIWAVLAIYFQINNLSSGLSEPLIEFYRLIVGEITFLNFLIYTILIYRKLAMFCGTEQGWFKTVFKFSNPRFNWLKVLNTLLLIHTIILFIDVNLNLLIGWPQKWFEWGTTVFLILISYVFLYGIINFPDIIHINKKQIGLTSPKKYSKPNLDQQQSKELMKSINQYMDKYKPFLNPDFCMADFSESIGISGHLISEVTNGLMKQNFFDYVNNYRIEEFKKLLTDPEKKNDKIMFLAYDAGFNSKTTFNTAFKKFTGQTPSEYRKLV